MINTIRFKLFALLFCILTIFFIALWAFNAFFLESFYQNSKTAVLEDSYHKIFTLYTGDISMAAFNIEKIEESKNVEICIADQDLNPIYLNLRQRGDFMITSPDKPEEENWGDTIQGNPDQIGRLAQYGIIDRLIGDNLDKFVVGGTAIDKRTDERTNLTYLTLYGTKNVDGRIIYMTISTSIAAIKEGVGVASGFSVIAGMLILVLGGISIFFLSKTITKPVERMSVAMDHISKLDFSDRINYKTKDELGQLANHINIVSHELEKSITDLKKANESLKEDIAQKEKIDAMRKEFITNVSHELKTPLSLVMGYSEGLLLNVNEEEKDYYCNIIINETKTMNKLVLRLLDLSQLESGVIQIEKEKFDLSELIGSCVNKNNFILKERGIEIKNTAGKPYDVFADYYRIEQVLTNYISNAIHHVDDKKEISIDVFQIDTKIRVTVTNSGRKIPKESMEKVWESFYKADTSRAREYGGTGLGLHIVKTIMDAHRNQYGCENLEGYVAFWFELDAAV